VLSADDTDVALLIERTDGAAGFVTVSAAGDLLLEQTDNATADTDIECDASIAAAGSRNGTIDVSVAACDTLGEICDIINSQGDDEWACVILDGLASDTAGPSGTGFILAATNTAASRSVDGGAKIFWDTSAAWTSTIALVPPELRKIESYYYVNSTNHKTFHQDVFSRPGYESWLYSNATSTYGSGTSTYTITSVDISFPSGSYDIDGTETATVLYSKAGGATTVAAEFATFATYGLPMPFGDKVVARLTNSAAMASVSHTALAAYK
jgi:hypothetical protein